MPPLTHEEFGPGRQVVRGDDTLDVLGTISSDDGGKFVIVTHPETQGMALLVPVSLLRDEETEFEAVDEEERQAKRRKAEEDRLQAEADERKRYEDWKSDPANRDKETDPTA